jgi:hypothetical protein
MSATALPIAKFRLGRLLTTPNALEQVPQDEILVAIQRHQAGDWGDVTRYDHCANEQALLDGTRLMSVYHTAGGVKFWIVTEADRSVTTVLLPEEY